MRLALDTNVLVYAEGVNGPDRRIKIMDVLDALDQHELIVPVQVLNELYSVLSRKGDFTSSTARDVVRRWMEMFPTIETDSQVLVAAMDLVVGHRIAFWDAIVLASAAAGGCQVLLSEDFQSGFTWRGVTVRNPFLPA